MKKRTPPPAPSQHVVSPALARRAAAVSAAARARHAREAEALIALVRARTGEIAGGFWDIGRALAQLAEARLYSSVGFDSFQALCDAKLALSPTLARKLIAIASQLPREEAVALRQERSAALLELAAARGVPPAELIRAPVRLPGQHRAVDVTRLSANKLKLLARDERHAHGRHKGETAVRAREGDRVVALVAKALAGVTGVKVSATVPRRVDAEPLLHVTVPLSALRRLARAVRDA